jgi:hypothetical protein
MDKDGGDTIGMAKAAWRKAIRRVRGTIGLPANQPKLTNPNAAEPAAVAFYDAKDRDVPRFVYRRLLHELRAAQAQDQRKAAIDGCLAEIKANGTKGDFVKMKWVVPAYLRAELTGAELAQLDAELGQRRARRNPRYREVYPHCADEFVLDPSFFDATLASRAAPAISRQTEIITLGSCFARNIAVYLKSNGYRADVFPLAEDLNSPLSNAKMLSVATASPEARRAYLEKWMRILLPTESDASIAKHAAKESEKLDQLTQSIRAADFVIVTAGNVFDFFIAPDDGDVAPEIPVAPKFLRSSNTEDMELRNSVSTALKGAGAKFRMANFAETAASLRALHAAIRQINPNAHFLFTLSPVPIDSAIGVEGTSGQASMELDCVSKSTLRTALHELLAEWSKTDTKVYYFPSFEIVRWIGAMLPIPIFGHEDAAARHVSADILNAVYGHFLSKFGVKAESEAAE